MTKIHYSLGYNCIYISCLKTTGVDLSALQITVYLLVIMTTMQDIHFKVLP